MTKFLGIIPARYQSSRFPGKPLAMLGNRPIIQWVYEQVEPCFSEVYVATDDERIAGTVEAFGGKAVMTPDTCKSGTDRCNEAYNKVKNGEYDVVVNVQGDEPFIRPEQIEILKSCFDSPQTQIATLAKPFSGTDNYAAIENANSPKVVIDKAGYALYFSRSVIPFVRDKEVEKWPAAHTFHKHLGIYAYRTDILAAIAALPQSQLEKAESLEQLRWLENGYSIKVGITDTDTVGIDTPEDLERARSIIEHNGINRHR